MSRTIHGAAHQAFKYFRECPASLAVYVTYVSRANREGVAWASEKRLVKDTGWGEDACGEGRRWLVAHGALEPVEGYVRPQWRNLPDQKRAQRVNLDRTEYFRPTGIIEIKGEQFPLLYTGEARGEEGDLVSDTRQDRVSEDTAPIPDASPHGTPAHMGQERVELDSYKDKELDSKPDELDSPTTTEDRDSSVNSDPPAPTADVPPAGADGVVVDEKPPEQEKTTPDDAIKNDTVSHLGAGWHDIAPELRAEIDALVRPLKLTRPAREKLYALGPLAVIAICRQAAEGDKPGGLAMHLVNNGGASEDELQRARDAVERGTLNAYVGATTTTHEPGGDTSSEYERLKRVTSTFPSSAAGLTPGIIWGRIARRVDTTRLRLKLLDFVDGTVIVQCPEHTSLEPLRESIRRDYRPYADVRFEAAA